MLSAKAKFRLLVLLAMVLAGCAREGSSPPLVIFHADSLSAYVSALAREFERSHPGVKVNHEGSGSLDAIRKITDLHRSCDIIMTADWRLLDKHIPGMDPYLVIFATNSLGLVYTERSAGAAEITADNWSVILSRPDVRYGHSNPERDPAGYWTLIVWQLAERYYHQPGLAQRLAEHCPASNVRPHNVDLISLLQSGELDYYFGYASDVRLGKDLKFVPLPPEVNLGDPTRTAEYGAASVEVGADGAVRRVKGGLIGYAAALASRGENREQAIEFTKLMMSSKGWDLAVQNGLVPYRRVVGSNPPSWLHQ